MAPAGSAKAGESNSSESRGSHTPTNSCDPTVCRDPPHDTDRVRARFSHLPRSEIVFWIYACGRDRRPATACGRGRSGPEGHAQIMGRWLERHWTGGSPTAGTASRQGVGAVGRTSRNADTLDSPRSGGNLSQQPQREQSHGRRQVAARDVVQQDTSRGNMRRSTNHPEGAGRSTTVDQVSSISWHTAAPSTTARTLGAHHAMSSGVCRAV